VKSALGPLVGSAHFTGSLETPYLVTATVSALFLPLGWMLVRRTAASASIP
jgi:hypothetical protein